ncbi:helix-turn-helix domain-containing protein [Dyadobacter sandarakinus]|uniref:Helix-turn-helix transcriptional regulator n=1 Tax=Dyadobacter sandarakinus TaxID=2747268 RepID=A0ABX7I563_9BACT|nr:AraC family transcriptional regulator [Dyadobacter sandarakinus]QRR00627.1 helix-turn-helix transcriptional regulator [Dyadobacter sandarakinus]
MRATVLPTKEVYDFSVLPNPLGVGTQPASARDGYDVHEHPQVGRMEFHNESFRYMHVVDMKWKSREAVSLLNDIPTDTVNFNFQLRGNNFVKFTGFKEGISSHSGEHSIFHHPEGTFCNSIPADYYMEVFHISLDKGFFASAICGDDRWTEQMQRNLNLHRCFTGYNKPLEITPRMWQLIGEIRSYRTGGPMRNLMVQSRALELVALQIEQMRTPAAIPPDLRPDEVEKLHFLKTYLDANFLSELTLAELSRCCVLNEFKVKRGFKLLFEMSVFSYLKKKRMEYAGELLQKKGLTVDEVSDILGYEHAQHFSTAFKNFMGVSPSVYRRQ